jgi:thiamine pyrophosphate-dependent acetolactate synthase large subunit-like protein
VILAGRGAVHADAADVVRRLAERTGALLATSLLAKNWLIDDPFHIGISGLYSTATAMQLLAEADCVLAVGASLNNDTTANGYLYPTARFIQVEVRPHVLMGGGKVADVVLEGDARRVCELLESRLTSQGHENTGYRTEKVATMLADAGIDDHEFDLSGSLLDPRDVCRELDRLLPPSIGLVLGGGHAVQIATMTCNRPRDRVLANQHFGCIGQGLTTAIGASLASGRVPYFLVEGDAGLMMHLVEFDTAVRSRVPVLVVVLNDQGLGAEYHRMGRAGLDSEMSAISTPDLGEAGRALGGRGRLVSSLAELEPAIGEFVADPTPTILDVRISRNVMSLPYRRVLLGADE